MEQNINTKTDIKKIEEELLNSPKKLMLMNNILR